VRLSQPVHGEIVRTGDNFVAARSLHDVTFGPPPPIAGAVRPSTV
jgi:hypothetical protein